MQWSEHQSQSLYTNFGDACALSGETNVENPAKAMFLAPLKSLFVVVGPLDLRVRCTFVYIKL